VTRGEEGGGQEEEEQEGEEQEEGLLQMCRMNHPEVECTQ